MSFKKIIFSLAALFICFSAGAQVGVNPEDEFYTDAIAWNLKGYVKSLPQFKPYPQNVILDILQQVSECNDQKSVMRAEYYMNKFYGRKIHVSAEANYDLKIKEVEKSHSSKNQKWEFKNLLSSEILTTGDYDITPEFGTSWEIGVVGFNNDVTLQDVHPKYIFDSNQQKIDVLSLKAGIVDFLLDTNLIFSYGNTKLFGTLGFNKTGFGLYPDHDIILNPASYQSFNGTFNYRGSRVEYSQFMALLGSKSKLYENSYSFSKVMSFHSIKMPLLNRRLNLSYYESSVGCTPFMMAYIMPVPYVIMGNVSGFDDNLMAGFNVDFKPMDFITLTADLLFDDLKPAKFIKFKWEEAAVRTTGRVGFIYAPVDSICNLITCNYTFVTPYTYTNYNTSEKEFSGTDYTNCGISVGSDLPPNSDRILVKMEFKSSKNITVSTFTSLARHSNPYLSLTDAEVVEMCKNGTEGISTDGSINSNTQGLDTALNYTNFLTQSTVMYTIQGGVGVEYELANTKTGSFTFGAGYKFEYIRQDGIDTPIYTSTYANEAEVIKARTEWLLSLHDSVNNYLSLTFKYTY